MDYQNLITEVYEEVQQMGLQGKAANYIPELANVDTNQFGICMVDKAGKIYGVGDYQEPFSIQSISKVYSLVMVFSKLKRELWKRVNVEPSGNPFNSMVQLEYEQGIPRNPFINAGALVVTDALISLYPEPKQAILDFIQKVSGEKEIMVNSSVQQSELEHSARNKALANFIQSFQNIENSIDKLIEVYTYHCSIEMNCLQLAKSFLFFCNNGYCNYSHTHILDGSSTKRLNALMLTCGFYDESGEFAFKVGLPGKSGVGGGIVAVLPGQFSVAVWSPGLNKKGNSVKGIAALELLTTKLGISLF
jgi:glutaminase